MRNILSGKIHRARVTEANPDYEGSISIDPVLMEASDILPFEQVHVLDVDNGARLQTYAIPGIPHSGEICLNGAAAKLIHKGDIVIILAYRGLSDAEARTYKPRMVYVDEQNQIVRTSYDGTLAYSRLS